MLKNGKFLFKIVLLVYLFLALLGLPCCSGFSLVTASRVTLLLRYAGFSLQWLLFWSTGFRVQGPQ